MTFTEKVRNIQNTKNSLLCIGLDPVLGKIPPHIQKTGDPIVEFNKYIIDSTLDLVCAYKFNLAFYEAFGPTGIEALEDSIELVPPGILTIGDGKRSDIGNSSERYAEMLFDSMEFDAVTVNPYMGTDSVEPFLSYPEKGVFVLALTSNPGAKDFQKLKVGKQYVYEKVVQRAKIWNTQHNVGLVVGATQPRELARIRKLAPGMPILLPGIGAQGGDLKKSVEHGCSKHRDLLLINIGRSIIYANNVRDAALELHDMINTYRTLKK
jgi:orotidine-5'-phosphate decarboxylase